MCLPMLGLLGTALSAVGTIAGAQAQAAQAKTNARIAEVNAKTARWEAHANADRKEDEYQRLRARQRVAAAGSGVRADQGSAALIINDATYSDQYLDTANIIWSGETKAIGYENKSAALKADAKNYKTAGYIGGASSLIGGLAKPGVGKAIGIV